ncbi:MAG: 4-amino-4-deoxy-L-arabinose transferase [Clostridiaceae bacterium]|nr:4-amino-4-deoxy-L-arabinose transferase [Clostridiaceae bacterium]
MLSKLDYILRKTVYYAEIIFIFLICILLLCNIFSVFPKPFLVVALYLAFCITGFLPVYIFKDRICTGSVIKRVAFTMLIAFIIRFLVIYFIALTQQGDYAIYLSTARKIAAGTLSDENKLYYGIFPHALNYPIFISFFYKVIGEKTWLTRVINLLFGVMEAGFGTYIMEKCTNSRIGIVGGLAVALNPSVIIFTLLSGGEPIYSSVILCALFILVSGIDKERPYLFLAAFGFICGIGNFFRPTALILIIASVLIILFYSNFKTTRKLSSIITIVLSYTIAAAFLSTVTASVSGYKSPFHSYGWNLFVGANELSQGKWNEQDGELFSLVKDDYRDPSKVQEHFFKLGIERYKNMGIKVIPHFKRKLGIWFDENYVSTVVTEWQTRYTRFQSGDLGQIFFLITNSYNLFIVLGAISALVFLSLDKKAPLTMKTISFYLIGSIMLYMIFETATRYKGAYYSVLTLLAVYGYWKIYRYIKSGYSRIKEKGT